jgi:lysozyme
MLFEGFHPAAYWDNGWAIGYGHHGPEVHQGLVYTREEAYEVLTRDISTAELCVERVSPNCVSGCRSGITDFVYNLGCESYSHSTLAKRIRQEDWIGARKELMRWVHFRGKVLPGLIKRRAAEARLLFLR